MLLLNLKCQLSTQNDIMLTKQIFSSQWHNSFLKAIFCSLSNSRSVLSHSLTFMCSPAHYKCVDQTSYKTTSYFLFTELLSQCDMTTVFHNLSTYIFSTAKVQFSPISLESIVVNNYTWGPNVYITYHEDYGSVTVEQYPSDVI